MEKNLKIVSWVKEGLALLQMDLAAMRRVFESKDSFFWGLVFLAFPVVANTLLAAFSFPSGFGSIFSKFVFWPIVVPFLALGLSFFGLALVLEKGFNIKIEAKRVIGLLGVASVVLWLSVLAFMLSLLGLMDVSGLFNFIWLAGIGWIFFLAYSFLVKVKGVSQKDALIAVLAAVFILFVVQILLGKIFVGSYYKVFY